MTVVHFDRTEQCPVEIGDLAISIDGEDNLTITGRNDASYVLSSLSGDGLEYDVVFEEENGLLIAGETSDRIWHIEFRSGDTKIFRLNRKETDDPDYYR